MLHFCKKRTPKSAYIASTCGIETLIIYGNTYNLVPLGQITGIGPLVIFPALSPLNQAPTNQPDRERMGGCGDDSGPWNYPKVTIRRFTRAATDRSRQLGPGDPRWDVSPPSASSRFKSRSIALTVDRFPQGLQRTVPQLRRQLVHVLGCVVHSPSRKHRLSLIPFMGGSHTHPTGRVRKAELVDSWQYLWVAPLY